MKRALALALSMALVGSVYAAEAPQEASGSPAKSTKKKMDPKKPAPSVSTELRELKEALETQQKQIQQLSDKIQSRDQHIQELEHRLDQSQAAATQAQEKADMAASQTAEQVQTVTALKTDVTDLKTSATNVAQSLQETQKNVKDAIESPLAIHYKGITITPGGFLAAESVYRTRALGADINTPFTSVNYPGSGQNDISEFFGSGRQSRITMLAEGKLLNVKMSGYYEADFLSSGTTSNNNESNSYTLRQRQVWGKADWSNGWSLTGGQMWSLVTETKKGVENRTEATPLTIDPAYTVGFSWARQYGVRVAKNFNNRAWLAASLENPQTIFSASNNAANFAFGSAGNSGGLYNAFNGNYSFNSMPDFIVKAAFEPGFGHYEVFGVLSRFRDRVYPCGEPAQNPTLCTPTGGSGPVASAVGAYNDSKEGGGVGANARVTFAKHLDFGLHVLYGDGVGRYGASTLADATVKPDGTLAPLRSYQGLATLEFHTPRLDVYLNGGEEYAEKRYSLDAASGKLVGYGVPSLSDSDCYSETVPGSGSGYGFGGLTCNSTTQSTIEGTLGFWLRLYQGPKGRLQMGPQYSYLVRNGYPGLLSGTFGTPSAVFTAPHGIDNMLFTSFRYYLP